ncbi:MAG: thiamine phosphate synthase [Flavobacteriales bacterium]|nr:thiamine phosphate synthase [Flavobacteriales bacterium]
MKKRIAEYQFITADIERHSHADLAEFACLGGASWVQVRVKDCDTQSWKTIAEEVQSICKKYNATFIINDNVHLAKELNADGVHLGRTDMPIKEARRILGNDKIIGGTANAIEEVVKLGQQGVDYIGLGPYCFTDTKKNLNTILGLEHMQFIVAEAARVLQPTIPIIAVGGIDRSDVEGIIDAGLYGCAVSAAVVQSEYKIIASAKFAHELRSILETVQ